MFFKTIHRELSSRLASVGMAMTFPGENKVCLIITPTLKAEIAEKAPHLSAPFVLTGTPDDLDAGFVDQFKAYSEVHTSLQQQVTDQIKALQEQSEAKAAKAKEDSAKKMANSRPVKPASPAAGELGRLLSGDDDPDDTGSDESNAGATPTPVLPLSVTSNAPMGADELF
ncbi:conserved hypothetical protein (plasmid) [Rhodoferax ferrireducens T118]|uniref:ParB-related ThiF-related cassette protein E domain-containing protein n=1 Tax=Albidiferax ferrireducens (strain ATCC BAA-621 / DSM 15236 / T118) TaxID=338969 RepID=Q21Q49_ALBFT|nr:PRTRC system protein E [Rhodoferax ferrireducens]ABD72096.1 conserved hypothetical protein [Rhodoferax ferrireducens T118]